MAKIGNAIITVERGRATILAVRRNGTIVKRRPTGGHYLDGRIKPGLTASEVTAIYRRAYLAPEFTVRCYVDGDAVIVTEKQAARRKATRQRAKAKRDAERAAHDAAVAKLRAAVGPLASAPLAVEAAYQTVRHACSRAMFCQSCERILDVDSAAIVKDTVICGRCVHARLTSADPNLSYLDSTESQAAALIALADSFGADGSSLPYAGAILRHLRTPGIGMLFS